MIKQNLTRIFALLHATPSDLGEQVTLSTKKSDHATLS